jgi:formamidopyrimidine-DNA glycosylase
MTEAEFSGRIAGRRTMIKGLLLNQAVFRGLGNIYTDKSLWRARIHPQRHGARLTAAERRALYRAIRKILEAAIRLGGSSISDYVDSDGKPGSFQLRHRAYSREGKPCFRCGEKIRRVIVAGRSSYFCPHCQPTPRHRRKGVPHGQRKAARRGANRSAAITRRAGRSRRPR